MAWYDEAVFYHIYPLGLCDAPKENPYTAPLHRLRDAFPWISHIEEIGCNALYIGPLFESVGHGYETTDYKRLDSRLGDNADLKDFVKECHAHNIRVVFDGVFNHVGRDFFAFKDLQANRERSAYRDWFCNVNFGGNNEYNDGFCYENWGGYNLLVKLNQHNPAVRDYICDVIRFWVKEFDIDGIRLDAADVLDFAYMKALRGVANEVKPDFWLMGEVIHGDYTRWVNDGTLHAVTNYNLHKALYSGHNDHNYFEIAHTVKRLYDMGGNRPDGLRLYNFVDNHDVERIYTKLNNKAHFAPVHVLLYTLPGVPSVYYGSEFAIQGKKEKFSDASLRPALKYEDYKDALTSNSFTKLIAALGKTRQHTPALSYGSYRELLLTNRQYAFAREYDGQAVIVTVNNDDSPADLHVSAGNCSAYAGALGGKYIPVENGQLHISLPANSGEIWLPANGSETDRAVENEPVTLQVADAAANTAAKKEAAAAPATPQAADSAAKPSSERAGKDRPQKPQAKTTDKKYPDAPLTQTPDSSTAQIPPDQVSRADTIKQPTKNEPEISKSTLNSDAPGASFEDDALHAAFEQGKIAGLQEAILAIMEKNGPVTDRMRKDVTDNVYHDSLINWVKSFR